MNTLLIGPNFSGRSEWLKTRRGNRPWPFSTLLGPTGNSSFTGLCWLLSEELHSARNAARESRVETSIIIDRLTLSALLDRPLHDLSGGETVRAALASALLQGTDELHIDCALEQLDEDARRLALKAMPSSTATYIIDNRIDHEIRSIFDEVTAFSPMTRPIHDRFQPSMPRKSYPCSATQGRCPSS